MPSGAKKRKIAKKKKSLQASSSNPNSSVQSQGSDDVQHYDDKGSDTGSPASQEHCDSEHPLAEGDHKDVEKRAGGSSDQLAVSEQSSQEVGVGSGDNVATEENIIQIDWELKSEEDYGSRDGSIESKEVHTGGSLSGSSGSSDDSSHSCSDDDSRVENKREVVEAGHAVDALWEAANQVGTTISAEEHSDAVREPACVKIPNKSSMIKEVVQIDKSPIGDYPAKPVDNLLEVQEVGFILEGRENADKNIPSSNNSTGISPVLMDLVLRKDDDKEVIRTEEKPAVPANVSNFVVEGKDAKLRVSVDAPTVHASKDAGHIKASDSPECSESKALVASAPQTMQKTSLKSCCGIFELFTSSDK
ncbi:hypothetical protein DCAR_0104215 [Daucus carota subsp. sativus]|uniref:Uncharacterized protein n=1 Tax=Daucus carota subsp. sativus TaxID=79200 RepID=A0A166IMU2_DAUCS|nr:PREDICTED: uncharacterized protein LOC108204526 [Daucus carota subsp. sativus]WOG85029.1 hypothetical protein DCAR_0104215 [Daucus carota subsp. sativus]